MNPSLQEQFDVGFNSAADETIRAQFTPVRQRLQLVLELSQSLATVLQGNCSLARRFNVPLAGDNMARKIDSLFGKLDLVRDDEEEIDDGICWLDVILAPRYRPTRREDGCYYLQLSGSKGWAKITESDHNIIKSGLPQKLVDPRSYVSDMQCERETMRLVEELLSIQNKLASQIIDINNDSRAKISERLGALEKFSSYIQGPPPIEDLPDDADLQTTGSPEPVTLKKDRKCKRSSAWEQEELDRLPQWYQKHKHLRKKEIETAFKADFRKVRSHPAIVSATYRAQRVSGRGRVGTKRKLHQNDSYPPSTDLGSSRATIPTGPDTSQPMFDSAIGSVSFLTALKSFSKPDRSSGGVTEMLSAELRPITHDEALTRGAATDGSSWNENQTPSAQVEIRSPDQTGTTLPAAEKTTLNDKSSGRGRRPDQGCSVDVRESTNPDENDPGMCETDNLPRFPTVNPQQGGISGATTAPTITVENLGAQAGINDCLPNYTIDVGNISPGITTVNSASTVCRVTGSQSKSRGNQPKPCDNPDHTSPLPIHQEQGQLLASHISSNTPAPANRSRKSRAPARAKRAGAGCDRCHRLRKKTCDGQRPSCNNCAKAQVICEGYKPHTPLGTKAASASRSQGSQYPQEGSFQLDSQGNPLEHVVERGIAAEQSGQQHNISSTDEGSSSIPSSGNRLNFASGQDTLGHEGVLTSSNRLPLPNNPGIGPQVIPPIDQILGGQSTPPNEPAFPSWGQGRNTTLCFSGEIDQH